MAVKSWLLDKSALVRLGQSRDVELWATRIEQGLVRISTITRLELGYSARSGKELRSLFLNPPFSRFIVEALSPAIEERAWDLINLLADKGQHRAPSIPDLLIAATAEKCGLTLLHLDKDFDLIAKFTGQSVEKLKI